VTELVTGIDIVREQLGIAAGKKLAFRQEDVRPRGHAIECRIYAEDPYNNFLPSAGRITRLRIPEGPGVRNDTGIFEGWDVSVYYDPLLAKLIVWGNDRKEAIERARRALSEYLIEGVATTIPFHKWIMRQPAFHKGEIDATFIDRKFSRAVPEKRPGYEEAAIIAAALDVFQTSKKVFIPDAVKAAASSGAWRLHGRLRQPVERNR
jgi:acetyl-CoA carboxylase biotin carboxylase subunit